MHNILLPVLHCDILLQKFLVFKKKQFFSTMLASNCLIKRVHQNLKQNIFSYYLKYCSYIQGQSPEPKSREYFYYIDHQGMLFLDDTKIKNFTSCFKDKHFLAFFFKRLGRNETNRYKEFPYLSLCGRERNFVRCDDVPIVFTHVFQKNDSNSDQIQNLFSYNYGQELLVVPFEPSKIMMNTENGRIYHPAPEKSGGIGLIKSSLAIDFSSMFLFENGEQNGPTHFRWQGKEHKLDIEWYNERLHNIFQ